MTYVPLPPTGQATSSNSLPVVLASDQSPVAVAPVALSASRQTALSATPVAIKVSAGSLVGFSFHNPGTSDCWVHFYDAASGSVTPGTTVPVLSYWVPPGGAWDEPVGLQPIHSFTTAITVAATAGVGTGTAPATALDGNVEYI